jgi:ubiquitin carboxyl-terminal hydrolase 4/11/15
MTTLAAPPLPDQVSLISNEVASHTYSLDESAYLLSNKWFFRLKRASRTPDEPFTVPIDNSHLLSNGNVKGHLILGKDMVYVPKGLWDRLHSWYGGGPPIEVPCLADGKKIVPSPKSTEYVIHYRGKDRTFTVYASELQTVNDLKKLACQEVGIDFLKETTRLRDYWNCIPHNPLEDSEILKNVIVLTGQGLLLEVKQDGVWPQYDRPAAQASASSHHGHYAPLIKGVCGIANYGSTCYLGAALQCLFHARCLNEYFIASAARSFPPNMRICSEFSQLLREYWSGTRAFVDPRRLKAKIAESSPEFAGYQQQDTHELLMVLLSRLQSETNTSLDGRDQTLSPRGDGENDPELAVQAWAFETRRNNSPIFKMINGLIQNRLVCPVCHRTEVFYASMESVAVTLSAWLPSRPITLVRADPAAPFVNLSLKLDPGADYSVSKDAIKRVCQITDDVEFVFAKRDEISGAVTVGEPGAGRGAQLAFEVVDAAKGHVLVVPSVYHFSSGRDLPKPFLVPVDGPEVSDAAAQAIRDRLGRFWGTPSQDQDTYDPIHPNDPTIDFRGQKMLVVAPPALVQSPLYRWLYDGTVIVHLNGEEMTASKGYNSALAKKATSLEDREDPDELVDRLRCIGTVHSIDQTWFCVNCQEKVFPTTSIPIWSVPQLLIFHLVRFTVDRGNKNDRMVNFPDQLDMAPFVLGPQKAEPLQYRVFGIVCHIGSTIASGHYTAFARHDATEKWYGFNDHIYQETSLESVHTRNAYVLFYERIDTETKT